ncbi:MAG TPA: hypothetical protein VGY55_05750 [Pirellulales bacterium]|jgi:hypothetical protein|nr:hypothetical protein [Pirellulales bacterium]
MMLAKFKMHRNSPYAAWRRGMRLRLCGWSSIALYLAVALGFSFPLPRMAFEAVQKDKSQPFPCMNSPCGCKDAEQCWRHCCCHTLAERLEWARENHVQPPDYVLAEAKAQGIDWRAGPQRDCCADHDCCAEHDTTCCCCHDRATKTENHDSDADHETDGSHDQDRSSAPGVVLIKALECQGIASNWSAAIVSLAPPPAVRWTAVWNPTGQIINPRDCVSSFSAQPPTPPPRSMAI